MQESGTYKFNFYGTDSFVTYSSVSLVSTATLNSVSDIAKMQLSAWRYDYAGENEGETSNGVGGILIANNLERSMFNIELSAFNKKSELDKYQQMKTILKKQNHFIEILTSAYNVALHSVNQAIAVAITEREENENNNFKVVRLTCKYKELD